LTTEAHLAAGRRPRRDARKHGGRALGAARPEVTLRCTGYDAQAAAEAMRATAPGYPGLGEFLAENVLTVPSDAEALAVFSG